MNVIVTGGTGFVGRRLVNRIVAKNNGLVIVPSRNKSKVAQRFSSPNVMGVAWDPLRGLFELPKNEVEKVDTVVNLMGESVAGGRWTTAKKQQILDSRVIGTRNLIDGLQQAGHLPTTFVSASAVGIYGDRDDEILTEKTEINRSQGNQFLIDVCQQWESEADRIAALGARVVKLRIGIVLGLEGGALEQMLPIFRLGGGGRLGSGKQWVPWIHIDDLIEMIIWILENQQLSGIINATAPNPIQNQKMTKEIARVLRRPAFLPAPSFALKLALGEFADELLSSKRVVPDQALAQGFSFRFTDFSLALKDLLDQA